VNQWTIFAAAIGLVVAEPGRFGSPSCWFDARAEQIASQTGQFLCGPTGRD